jgi:hypothetical protein
VAWWRFRLRSGVAACGAGCHCQCLPDQTHTPSVPRAPGQVGAGAQQFGLSQSLPLSASRFVRGRPGSVSLPPGALARRAGSGWPVALPYAHTRAA